MLPCRVLCCLSGISKLSTMTPDPKTLTLTRLSSILRSRKMKCLCLFATVKFTCDLMRYIDLSDLFCTFLSFLMLFFVYIVLFSLLNQWFITTTTLFRFPRYHYNTYFRLFIRGRKNLTFSMKTSNNIVYKQQLLFMDSKLINGNLLGNNITKLFFSNN